MSTVADHGRRFPIPLGEEIVDGVLDGCRISSVVFWCYEDESVVGGYFGAPGLRVGVRVLGGGGYE